MHMICTRIFTLQCKYANLWSSLHGTCLVLEVLTSYVEIALEGLFEMEKIKSGILKEFIYICFCSLQRNSRYKTRSSRYQVLFTCLNHRVHVK